MEVAQCGKWRVVRAAEGRARSDSAIECGCRESREAAERRRRSGAMAADTAVTASPEETLESLLREAEALKQKLEEERQKLNDVTRESHGTSLVKYMPAQNYVLDMAI